MPEWIQLFDPQRKRNYYYNTQTGARSLKEPAGYSSSSFEQWPADIQATLRLQNAARSKAARKNKNLRADIWHANGQSNGALRAAFAAAKQAEAAGASRKQMALAAAKAAGMVVAETATRRSLLPATTAAGADGGKGG